MGLLACSNVEFLIQNWFLVATAIVSGVLLFRQSGATGGSGISPEEAVRLINREKGVMVDVCEPHEFEASHAKPARNIPMGSLASSKDLPGNKNTPLILMCPRGQRSARSVATLKKLGFENVVAVKGGTHAWREANLPMASAAKT